MSSLAGEKVIVTGANGFIGYHLTERLIREGAIVHPFIHSNDNRVKTIKEHCEIHNISLLDKDLMSNLIRRIKPLKVFHLAAAVNVERSNKLLTDMMKVNFQGTINLISALDEVNYDCFINTGTCEEYGINPVPFKEDQCPNPVSPYSLSKATSTLYCSMLARTKDYPIVTLRPFLTYGPFQTAQMLIPDTIKKALRREEFLMTKGEQTREFNFVDDIVDGYVKAAVTPAARGEVINVGNGREYTIREVVTKILDLLDNPITPLVGALPYRDGETWHFYCDNSKAKKILGWSPSVELEDGLKTTVDWFIKHPGEWRN